MKGTTDLAIYTACRSMSKTHTENSPPMFEGEAYRSVPVGLASFMLKEKIFRLNAQMYPVLETTSKPTPLEGTCTLMKVS